MEVLGPQAQTFKKKKRMLLSDCRCICSHKMNLHSDQRRLFVLFFTLVVRNWRHHRIKRPPFTSPPSPPRPTPHWMYNELKSNYKCSLPQTNSTLASKMQMCGIFCCDESLCARSEPASHASVAASALFPLSQSCREREREKESKQRLVISQQNCDPWSF